MKRYLLFTLMMILGCAVDLQADDTEIYGTVVNPSLEPNVMILFDTSGSMATADVPGDPYDPAQTYTCRSCTYSRNAVYYRHWNSHTDTYEWLLFTSSIDNISCASIKDSLLSVGYAQGNIRSSAPFACGGTNSYRLRLGNYLNYDASGVGDPQRRIDVAKQVLTDLIASTDGVRLGMFVFNYEQGGHLTAACGTGWHRGRFRDLLPPVWSTRGGGSCSRPPMTRSCPRTPGVCCACVRTYTETPSSLSMS